MRIAAVLTHRRPSQTGPAIEVLRRVAARQGVVLRFSAAEAAKHGIESGEGVLVGDRGGEDLCFALGGDGTMLSALRDYAGTGVPVFGVNFGEIGFLATIEPDDIEHGFGLAFRGEFETIALPAVALGPPDSDWLAVNDISLHRQPGNRVADLSYAVGEEEVGRVRCDGLVVATPVGSTGYNLANGGPVMAWGVAGAAVSFVAPHTLTARGLVLSPDDVLTVRNGSREEPVDVTLDGRLLHTLGAGHQIDVRFRDGQFTLAQMPGTTFYRRLREKFGRLTTNEPGR